MPFVIDNSVVCGWFLDNLATPYTAAVGHRLQDDRAVAPAIWELELINVLRTACARERMPLAAAHVVVEQLMSLPIDVDRKAVPPSEILGLTARFGLTSYEAAYLELALRLALPIATVDRQLREAASAAGVGFVAADV